MATINEAIEFSKENPNDPKSVELRRRMESGMLNKELAAAGLRTFDVATTTPTNTINRLAEQGTQAPLPPQVETGIFKDMGQDLKRTALNLREDVFKRGRNIRDILKRNETGSLIEAIDKGTDIAGQIAGGVGDVAADVVGGAISVAAPPAVEEAAKDFGHSLLDTAAGRKATEAMGKGLEEYEIWRQSNPEFAQEVENVFAVGELFGIAKGAQVVGGGIIKGGKKLEAPAARTKQLLEEDLPAARKEVVEAGKAQATFAREQIRAKKQLEIEGLVGKITAEKNVAKRDVLVRALSDVDTTDVAHYRDLTAAAQKHVEDLSTSLRKELDRAGQGKTFTADDLKVKTVVGDKVVEQDFLTRAVDDLIKMNKAVGDDVELAQIQALKQQISKEGISLADANDIAIKYGNEFGEKAFGKTGDALTSTNAKAFENTRKGLKTSVRDQIPEGTAKEIDQSISDAISLRTASRKMEEAVNKLELDMAKRGAFERGGSRFADLFTKATGGSIRGFLQRLLVPRGAGFKKMNAFDKEIELQDMLREFDKLDEGLTDEKFAEMAAQIIRQNIGKAELVEEVE